MEQPPGFVDPSQPTLVCKLHKALYGISVQSTAQGFFLFQQKYASELLLKAGMTNCKPCATPTSAKPSLPATDSLPFSQPFLFRSRVGALQYLTITHPGISYAVNQACQHMHALTVAHFSAVKRILRYIKGSLSRGLLFAPGFFHLTAYSDSNWAGDATDRHSTSGYCVFLGSNLISWSSKKQSTVSRSSTEAEYRSLAHTAAELTWLQMLLADFHIPQPSPPVLWCDNMSALSLATNPVFHSRSKHIEVDCHFIREKVARRQFFLKYVPSLDQLADIFTKSLSTARFSFLTSKLRVGLPPLNLRGHDKAEVQEVHQV
ncbi:uncharacterized protein LOC114310743 [Camellia sinensis]|uniref:uncharacterized protein LOC114310743 n=1 Tax=Camellia sinensis TaxID=4442 RepID=UPI001036850D|nr:uncharacterized protein LOC114310743 [Camellia sinensis]